MNTCPNCGSPQQKTQDNSVERLSQEIDNLTSMLNHGMNSKEKWLDMRDICAYTSLSESTIRRAVASGTLKSSKTTGKLLFKKCWVDRWLEAN